MLAKLIKTVLMVGSVLLLADYVISAASQSSFRIQSQLLQFKDQQADHFKDQQRDQRFDQQLALSRVNAQPSELSSGLSDHHKQATTGQAIFPQSVLEVPTTLQPVHRPTYQPLNQPPNQSNSSLMLDLSSGQASSSIANSSNQINYSVWNFSDHQTNSTNRPNLAENSRRTSRPTIIVLEEGWSSGSKQGNQKMNQRMAREQQIPALLPSNETESFPHKNHTLDLLHRLIDKFNNFTETRIRLLKRNQSQLVKSLNDFLSNHLSRHQHFQLKVNQTKLRQMFELDGLKRTNRTSKIRGGGRGSGEQATAQRLLEELIADEEPKPDPPRPRPPGSQPNPPHKPDYQLTSQIIKTKSGYDRHGQMKNQKMKKYSYSSPNRTMIMKVVSKDKTSKKQNKLVRLKSSKQTGRITTNVQPSSKMSKMLSNLSPANSSSNRPNSRLINSSDEPNNNQPNYQLNDQLANSSADHPNGTHTSPTTNSTDPQQIDCTNCNPHCENACKQTTRRSAPADFKTTTTSTASPLLLPPSSWKQVLGQRFHMKKSSGGGAEHSSTINSTMDLDIAIRPNSSAQHHRNLNLKSILKKSKLLAPRKSAQQTMPNSTFPQTNYLSQDGLNALPACTILDVFCWCYRLTRFLFIVRY